MELATLASITFVSTALRAEQGRSREKRISHLFESMSTTNDDADDAPLPPQMRQILATMDPRRMFPDIAEAYLSGEVTQEAAANEIVGRLTRLTAPRPIPDDWRVVCIIISCGHALKEVTDALLS